MRCLLEKALCSILRKALVRLSQNGVQRLSELVTIPTLRKIAGHYQLKPLNRISSRGGSSNVDWHGVERVVQRHQSCLRHHALNWEADACQIEVAIQDLATNHLSDRISYSLF